MTTAKRPPAQFHPFLYSFDIKEFGNRTAVRYSMPLRAYEALKQAQGISPSRNANIGGLAAVLGWAAPAVDLITFESAEENNFSRTLCFWIIDPLEPLEQLERQAQIALDIWMGLTLTQEDFSAIQSKLHDGRFTSNGGCTTFRIGTDIKPGGVCARPVDNRMYSLLTLFAARQLEGALVNQQTSEEGVLICTGPQNDLYSGKSLLRYPPSQIERGNKTGLWTEVFTVVALNTPEQSNLRVAVNIGIRNFGAIHQASLFGNHSRYVDIFLPCDRTLSRNAGRMRCVELELNRLDYSNSANRVPTPSRERKVLMKLMEMSGIRDIPESVGLAPFDLEEFSLYPRLGSNHGDRYAMAGTGIPAPERENYLQFLDSHLLPAGFKRVEFTERPYKQARSLKNVAKTPQELRAALARATEHAGKHDGFWLTRFADGLIDSQHVLSAMESLFGAPLNSETLTENTVSLSYEDGFKFTFQQASAGPLAEKVAQVPLEKLTLLEKLNPSMRYAAKQSMQNDVTKAATDAIDNHIAQFSPSRNALWAALVEMPNFLQDEPSRDPFLLNYAALAARGAVTQTKLINHDDELTQPAEDDSKANLKRLMYENALLDILRSAGVCPLKSDQLRLAGWWVLDRNEKSFEKRPGELAGLLTPLYADCLNGSLRVCLLNQKDEPEWLSYSEALLRIMQRQVHDLSKLKKSEQTIRIEQFFASVTPTDPVPTVIFTEATNIRRFVKGLGNDALSFGQLALGAIGGATPQRELASEGAISLVRITNEPRKSPCYWVSERKQGIAKGFFQEQGAINVFWLNRGLTEALHLGHSWANSTSRFEEKHSKKYAHRRFPTLSEVAIVLSSKGMQPDQLAGITRKAMNLHLATDEETLLPFPLHELSLIR